MGAGVVECRGAVQQRRAANSPSAAAAAMVPWSCGDGECRIEHSLQVDLVVGGQLKCGTGGCFAHLGLWRQG